MRTVVGRKMRRLDMPFTFSFGTVDDYFMSHALAICDLER